MVRYQPVTNTTLLNLHYIQLCHIGPVITTALLLHGIRGEIDYHRIQAYNWLSVVYKFVYRSSVFCSHLTFLFISINRLCIVSLPLKYSLKYKGSFTIQRMKHALRGIWIVSFAWGTFCGATAWKKYLKQQHYLDNLRWELKWSLSLSAMTLLTLIWIKTMFGLKRAVIKHKKVSNDQGHIPMKQQQGDQHITRLFFIMILSFYICYIPDMVKNAYYNEKWTPVI